MDNAALYFAVIAGWLGFNAIVVAFLAYCAPGDRLWRRPQLEPADGGQDSHQSEEETAIVRMLKPT
ncbi:MULTISPECIES: hypothetical protein [unclassified Bradyrhizobium]